MRNARLSHNKDKSKSKPFSGSDNLISTAISFVDEARPVIPAQAIMKEFDLRIDDMLGIICEFLDECALCNDKLKVKLLPIKVKMLPHKLILFNCRRRGQCAASTGFDQYSRPHSMFDEWQITAMQGRTALSPLCSTWTDCKS